MKFKKLIIYSSNVTSNQVVLGLNELKSKGIITIDKVLYEPCTDNPGYFGEPFVKLINHKGEGVFYDMSDSLEIYNNQKALESVKYYFKRSFKSSSYSGFPFQIFPLGFNSVVFGKVQPKLYLELIKASYHQKSTMRFILSHSRILSKILPINSSIENQDYNRVINLDQSKKEDLIIFNTRLWPPERGRNDLEKEKRRILNQRRIDFVIALRKEFGKRFIGGIMEDDYSIKQIPKDIILSKAGYQKGTYFKNLNKAKVGITVHGKHQAGLAIGEYCAKGVSIVCDPLMVIPPGNFIKDKNYFEASNTSRLIEATEILMTDDSIRSKMVIRNYDYYFNYVYPTGLVLNSLLVSLSNETK